MTKENIETAAQNEVLTVQTVREIVYRPNDNRFIHSLQTQPFNSFIMSNYKRLGIDIDDLAQAAKAHHKANMQIVAVKETTIKKMVDQQNGQKKDLKEVKNIWISWKDRFAEFFTPEEAATIAYDGKTALDWASVNGRPEMVVRAADKHFYPASKNDTILATKLSSGW